MNLERALANAPDPVLARTAWERVCEQPAAREILERPIVAPVAIQVLGFSQSSADFLVKYPEEAGLFAAVTPRSRANLDLEVAGDVERFGPAAGLRRFRRRAMLRIAARDLAGASLDEVVHEITDVADACWSAAVVETPGAEHLAAIALGKWGGRELNYSSDVDLLFVHGRSTPADNEAAEAAAGSLVHLLSDPTADGMALRVDTALRPGGRAGALSRSLDATLAYYERGSATWERQAMIKARAAAGDRSLGHAFVTGVLPFVYPEHLEPAAIDDVRRTKVRLEEYIRQRGKELTEVKRGRGGIRDVEFAVQLLQIVHGRRNAALRSPNTLVGAAGARRRGLRRRRGCLRAGRGVPIPAPAGAPAADRPGPADPRPAGRPARAHDDRALSGPGGRRRAAVRVRPHDRARPIDPRAPVLPAAPGGVRRTGPAAAGRRSRRDAGAPGRTGLRAAGSQLRGARPSGGPVHQARQGARARPPRHDAGDRARRGPRCGADAAGARRGGGRGETGARRCPGRRPRGGAAPRVPRRRQQVRDRRIGLGPRADPGARRRRRARRRCAGRSGAGGRALRRARALARAKPAPRSPRWGSAWCARPSIRRRPRCRWR